MNIPRIDNELGQDVLNDNDLTIKEKAQRIARINYDLCCLETDGKLPSMPSVEQIERAIYEAGL